MLELKGDLRSLRGEFLSGTNYFLKEEMSIMIPDRAGRQQRKLMKTEREATSSYRSKHSYQNDNRNTGDG